MVDFTNEYYEIRRGLNNIVALHNCVFYDLPYGHIDYIDLIILQMIKF